MLQPIIRGCNRTMPSADLWIAVILNSFCIWAISVLWQTQPEWLQLWCCQRLCPQLAHVAPSLRAATTWDEGQPQMLQFKHPVFVKSGFRWRNMDRNGQSMGTCLSTHPPTPESDLLKCRGLKKPVKTADVGPWVNCVIQRLRSWDYPSKSAATGQLCLCIKLKNKGQ